MTMDVSLIKTLVMTTRSPGLAANPCCMTNAATCASLGLTLPSLIARPRSPIGSGVRTNTRSAVRSRMISNFVCGVNFSVELGVFGSLADAVSGNSKNAVAKREKQARFIRSPQLRLIIFLFGVPPNARKNRMSGTRTPSPDARV